MFLALREIRHQPARFSLIVAIVSLVALLSFFLCALAIGLAHSYRAAVDQWDSSAVVLTDASNSSLAASRLTPEQVDAAAAAAQDEGLTATALIAQGAVIERVGQSGPDAARTNVYAFGTDLDSPLAPAVVEGSPISDPAHEVLLDDSLASEGWAVGDTLTIAGTEHEWRVVGFTHDVTFQATGVLTVDAEALAEATSTALPTVPNAVVLSGADWPEVPASLTDALGDAGLTALSPADFVDELPGYSAQVLTFSLMIIALILIAALVLAIFIYVLTLQKRAVLGVLKARGVPTAYLVASGCLQTAVLAATGVAIGLGLTLLAGLVLPDAVPFMSSPPLIAAITGAFILFAVLGGLISVRVVARIDPVEAIA